MLNKDEKKRPKVIDIMKMQFVQAHIIKFIESQGKNNMNPKLTQRKEI